MIVISIALQFTTAPEQETNQTETIHFDTRGARDDEEDHRQQADTDLVEGTVDRFASFFWSSDLFIGSRPSDLRYSSRFARPREPEIHSSRCVYYSLDSEVLLALSQRSPPLRPAEKDIKHPRPAVVNDVVTPEGTRYSKLFFDAASKGAVINVPHEYSFTTEGVQQAQINLPRGKSTGRLAILVVKHKET